MKPAFKVLFESIMICFLGSLAVRAASHHHWLQDTLFSLTALILATNSFLNYRLDYKISPPANTTLRWPEHYAIEILKSFMLFTCGEGMMFEFTHAYSFTGLLFLTCAAGICALVFERELKTLRRLAS